MSAPAPITIDAGDTALRDQLDFLGVGADEVIELQALDCNPEYPRRDNRSVFVRAADACTALRAAPTTATGIYLVVNRIWPQATTKRALGKWAKMPKGAGTRDSDIECRRVLAIDCDAIRPSGTSASAAQKARAVDLAARVRAYLVDECGLSDLAIGEVDSGNGRQLWIALADLPVDAPAIERTLDALAARFASPGAVIDTTCHDPKRILPAAGSVKRKGVHSDEYPHRPVRFDGPGLVHRLTEEELTALADRIAPITAPKPGLAKADSVFARANMTPIRDAVEMRGDKPVCPRCGSCDSGVFITDNNGVWCSHNRCKPRPMCTPVDAVMAREECTPLEAARKLAGEPATPANDTASTSSGVQILTAADLFAPQSDAAFLVKDLGIAPGAPTFLIGQGFVGKTITAMSLGVSVATGRKIWGQPWKPTRTGSVLHLDYEQGRRVTSKRLQRIARALDVTQGELDGRWGCVVLPTFDLTSAGALDTYARLFEGQALVILDSLKGATPGVEENSSAIRDYVRILTAASERTGATCLVIHHAGKTPMAGQTRPRKEMGRGSSALFDEAQSVFVLTGEKGAPFLVTHEKDRERGETVSDFSLRIVDTENDGLAVQPFAAPPQRDMTAEREAGVRARILEYVAANPAGPFGADSIRAAAKVSDAATRSALRDLLDAKLIHNAGTGSRPRYEIVDPATVSF